MGRASKDKRDIFYRLAKEEGWRARSAYKLIHINQTFNIFENVTKAVDLCAAPGSWSQVLAQTLPKSEDTRIVAVDLQTMAPIPGVVCLKGDITRELTAHQIIARLGHSKAQLVVCDGAPDVIGFHQLDEYFQSQLVLAALNIALAVLEPGGTFIAKFFRASPQGVRSMFLRFKVFFEDVVLTKPRSSRISSIECFIVARKFRLPEGFTPGPYYPFNQYNDLIGQDVLDKVNKPPEEIDWSKAVVKPPPLGWKPIMLKTDVLGEEMTMKLEMGRWSSDRKVQFCDHLFTKPPGFPDSKSEPKPVFENPSIELEGAVGGEAPKIDLTNLPIWDFLEATKVDHEAEDQIWLEYLKGFPELKGKKVLPPGYCPPNFRKPLKIKMNMISVSEPVFDPSDLYVPCVTSGDLNGFDSDTTYPVPKGYKSLPPVQPPITPPYAEAVAKRKENLAKGEKRQKYEFRYFTGENAVVFHRLQTTEIHLTFGGGAEKLVGNYKTYTAKLELEITKKVTLTVLIDWIKENLIVERPELLFTDGDVRPGILLLVNDMDYELLEDGINHELTSKDRVSFISTLHGG